MSQLEIVTAIVFFAIGAATGDMIYFWWRGTSIGYRLILRLGRKTR